MSGPGRVVVALTALAAAAVGLRRLAARSNTQVHRINQTSRKDAP